MTDVPPNQLAALSAATTCNVPPSGATGASCYTCHEARVKLPGFICGECKSQYCRQLYEDRIAMGLCTICGWRPLLSEGRSHCQECHEKEKVRSTYGVGEFCCFRCQLGLRYKDALYCKHCLEAETRDREDQQQARIESGLCSVCGDANDDLPSYTLCKVCRSSRGQLSGSVASGICLACDRPWNRAGGYRTCQSCRLSQSQQSQPKALHIQETVTRQDSQFVELEDNSAPDPYFASTYSQEVMDSAPVLPDKSHRNRVHGGGTSPSTPTQMGQLPAEAVTNHSAFKNQALRLAQAVLENCDVPRPMQLDDDDDFENEF
ncbi:hypothetical protein PG984_012424 [Apiospora sp. TS-2023a]